MKRVVFFLLAVGLLTVITLNGYAHEGEDNEEPRKVTSETIAGDHSESGHDEQAEAAMEKDFQTIRDEVARSAVFVIIKTLALAVAIAGIALVYLGRKRQGDIE